MTRREGSGRAPVRWFALRILQLAKRAMKPSDWISTGLGVLALAVSLWSLAAGRSQDRLSQRPHLKVDELFAPSSLRIGLEIINIGPGTAIPDSFSLFYRGRSLKDTPDESYVTQWRRFRQETCTTGWTNIGAFEPTVAQAPAGKDILIILDESDDKRSKDPYWNIHRDLLRTAVEGLTIQVDYHSVHQEQFRMRKTVFGPHEFFRPRGFLAQLWLNNDWEPWTP